jgi:uncharacterized membrane protein
MKISPLHKIILSALFLALIVVFNKLLSLQNLPLLPFARFSLGPALIIFASIILGPLFGGLIGGLSDVIGFFLFDFSGFGFFPLITLLYVLLGVLPWLFKFLTSFKTSPYFWPLIFYGLLLTIILLVRYNLDATSTFVLYGTSYTITDASKIIILIVLVFITFLFGLAFYFLDRYLQKKGTRSTIYRLALICFLCEVLLMLLLGSQIKSYYFQVPFQVIFFVQLLMLLIDVPMNTFVVTLLLLLVKRLYHLNEKVTLI